MDAILNVVVKLLAFSDPTNNSNPRLRHVDWTRDMSGIAVRDPRSQAYEILPGSSLTVFNGTRTTTIDSTTAFTVSLLPINGSASQYRFTYVSGTAPGFRTSRSLAVTGVAITMTMNTNATLGVHAASGIFGSVIPGDSVFIPNTTTGDSANVFSVLNSGYWQVLSVASATDITLVRPVGQAFSGANETQTPESNSQFVAFSAAGVQIGDSVDINAGFNTSTLKVFEVVNVTDSFFEVVSSAPLALDVGVTPGASGMAFYSDSKQMVYVEADQEVAIQINGDTGQTQRVGSFDPSDPTQPGVYLKIGPTWSLTIVNRSVSLANVIVIHAAE